MFRECGRISCAQLALTVVVLSINLPIKEKAGLSTPPFLIEEHVPAF
jgi:hypothetical protein